MTTQNRRFMNSRTVWLVAMVIGLTVLIASSVLATVVAPEEARQVSRNWLNYQLYQNGTWADDMMPRVNDGEAIYHEGVHVGYYFAVEPSGYIVVPILKELPAIKAYSENGRLDLDETQGIAGLLKDVLLHRIQLYEDLYGSMDAPQPATGDVLLGREHGERWELLLQSEADFDKVLAEGGVPKTDVVGPLLTEDWHQGGPFNELCPMGDGGRSVVGCVATASSMIMHFWNWPPSGTGSHSYSWDGDDSCDPPGTDPGGTLTADFTDGYDWGNMLDDYDGGWTAAQADAVSELCYEVAVAFEMDFGSCGSGAFTYDAVTVFPNHFRYLTPVRENRDDYDTGSDWFERIKPDINAGWPIQYRIKGHSIVCDGWKDDEGDDEVHMNYGWGGSARDIWYIVDHLHCPWDGCGPDVEYLIRGIRPNNTAPVAQCTDVTVYADANCEAEASIDNGSYDPDGQALIYTQIPTAPYSLGVTHVMLIVEDPQGATDVCYADVTVIDDTPPIAQCPGNMTVGNDPGFCSAVVTFAIDVTDNCAGATVVADPPSGSTFDRGTTTVYVTATDASGNTDVCSFTVTVLDTEAPVAECPADMTVPNDPDMCSAVVDFTFSATDNCPGVTAAAIPPPLSTFELGTTTVIVTATDLAGNTGTCGFDVTVIDTQNPEITCPNPEELEVVFVSPSEATVDFEATAVDNCDDDPDIDYFPPQGSVFPIGTNTVVCIATDFSGNADTCEFSFVLVYLDIKPGSCPNAFNIKPYLLDSKGFAKATASDADDGLLRKPNGVMPIAILGTPDLDVHDIPWETVLLNGVSPIKFATEDVAGPAESDEYCGCTIAGPDGFMDLTLKYYEDDLVASLGSVANGDVVQLLVTGPLNSGLIFYGGDCVLIRGPKSLIAESPGAPVEDATNYPNPFNPSTEISFSLDRTQHVTLDVFNLLGRRVAVLHDGVLQAGQHVIPWNGSDQSGMRVSSGVYFYRLSAGDTIVSRKMLLLK